MKTFDTSTILTWLSQNPGKHVVVYKTSDRNGSIKEFCKKSGLEVEDCGDHFRILLSSGGT
jgi:selenophosphate synthetase-related protein